MLTIWIGLIVIAVVVDLLTSNIMFSWLVVGFLLAIIGGLFGLSPDIQIIIACGIGVIVFMVGSRLSRNYLTKNIIYTPVPTNKLIGTEVVSEKRIETSAQHKVNGIYWTVYNEGPLILEGDRFRVIAINNNKLIVEKVD